jgi:selenocysteine lyase/cysteine desulfurase
MSPLLRRVEDAGIAGVRRKRDPTAIHADDFFRESDRARDLFGRLVNAPAQRMAVIPAASYGISLVVRNLPVQRGQGIIVAAEQFPSNVLPWRALAHERGLELRTVAPPDRAAEQGGESPQGRGAAWNERLLEAIDQTTAVVALAPVHWTDGTRFDLEAIGTRARAAGAALIVDGTQAVGALPFDVARVRPDALICAAYKWLLGPYSLGLAYFGPRFDDAHPLEETWLGRMGSEDFRGLVHYRDEYRTGMERLDVGERSSFHLMPMMVAALEQLLAWGVERIQDYSRRLVGPLVDEAQQLGYVVEEPEWRAGHLFGLRMPPGLDLERLRARLDARRISVSLRGSALRVSPGVWCAEDDVAALAAVLKELV